MRRITLRLLGLLMIAACANYAAAQQPAPKPPPSTKNETPREMTAVERAAEDARNRGETVVASEVCVEDCEDERPVIVGRAVRLAKPDYPAIARAAHAEGEVEVQVLINLEGEVIAASAISGHPLLQAAAVKAARDSRFAPTQLEGKPVNVFGLLKYNFVRP